MSAAINVTACAERFCLLRSGPALECVAGNVGMPVHKRASWTVLPCPDMQGIKRRQSEAVGAFEELKELTHQLRRVRVRRIPRVGEHQIVRSDEAQSSIR